MFRTHLASIIRSNFLQTEVAATGVFHRYGVNKSRVGVIGSVYYIDGFEVLPVSGGKSCYVYRGGFPCRKVISSESLCLESISGRICNCCNVLC